MLLNKDPKMIERMEKDLAAKVTAAFEQADISSLVRGVYSADELEAAMSGSINKSIGVGVMYVSAARSPDDKSPQYSQSSGGSAHGRLLIYNFVVLLAVPTEPDCEERYDATQVLTVMRLRVQGTKIDGDAVSRTWDFEKEGPNIAESTSTMLFYSQVWRVALPNVGP